MTVTPANPPAMGIAPGMFRMSPLGTATGLRLADPRQADVREAGTNAHSGAAGGFTGASFGRGLTAQRSFAEALGAARRAEGLEALEERDAANRAREAAEQLVSTTLVLPVLKQLRESNNAAPPFGPTDAEKQFGSLLDHRLAHDIVKGANFPMVDRLARDLLRNSGTTA
ncbi:MAG: hypothetical protein LAT64_09710 [Phycisphaerales bacterium]|nr:hypothetical protein [Planctomycetota bacterium]MCH8509024.1 hypothetical protein [Phycisphaerales bacterium]